MCSIRSLSFLCVGRALVADFPKMIKKGVSSHIVDGDLSFMRTNSITDTNILAAFVRFIHQKNSEIASGRKIQIHS